LVSVLHLAEYYTLIEMYLTARGSSVETIL